MSEYWMLVAWIGSVFLFLVSAFFSSSETAIMGVNRIRLHAMVEKGDRRALVVQQLLNDTARLLSGILLGNNFANVMLASLATALAVPIWGDMAPIYVSPILTILLLVFAEIIPKTIASQRTIALARLTAPILSVFITLASPFIKVTTLTAGFFIRPFIRNNEDDDQGVSAEDLATMAVVGHNEGSFSRVTHDILKGLSLFSTGSARDVLIPRHEMTSICVTEGIEGFRNMVADLGHTRIPVWRENEEDIVGVVHAKDLLHQRGVSHESDRLESILRPPVFVPEASSLGRVLRSMQESKSEMVFVVDEYGGLEGIVTLKDVIEELVGEIEDEHDKSRNRRIDLVREGTIIADASVSLRYLLRKTDLNLLAHDEGARTLGGLVFAKGQAPLKSGDSIEVAGVTITILATNGRFLRKLRLDWTPEAPPSTEDLEN